MYIHTMYFLIWMKIFYHRANVKKGEQRVGQGSGQNNATPRGARQWTE